MFNRIPGTKDILPDEIYLWQTIENISRDIFALYDFKEIRPPVIEDASLFNRSLGEFTEIVQKQMFLIAHQDDLYALRPEGTASVVRAYIENHLDKTLGAAKLYYIGPMFRLERPQKGRLRQFHHIGAEVIGSSSCDVDIEIISLANRLLREYKIDDYEILINSLGCHKDKQGFIGILREKLKDKLNDLCPDCNDRFHRNVLRILDCKNESCKAVVNNMHLDNQHLCQDCREHFSKVESGLKTLGIRFTVSPLLVRGLDYYTRTVFEIKHAGLGAQDAIGAGGRYDNLVKDLGGPDLCAVGFAFGVERVLLAAKDIPKEQKQKKLAFVFPLGDKAQSSILELADNLRLAGIPTAQCFSFEEKSLKGAMRQANNIKASHFLIIGDNELKNGVVSCKDMSTGEQKEYKKDEIINKLKDNKPRID